MYHFENITNHLTQTYNLVNSLLVESETGNCDLCYSNNTGRPKFLTSKETLKLFWNIISAIKKQQCCSTSAKEQYKEEFTSTNCIKRNITTLVMMNLRNWYTKFF